VLPKYSAAILVHGCFWHAHGCSLTKMPKTRSEFWKQKLEGNQVRDARQLAELRLMGWRTLVIWECALRGPKDLVEFTLHNAANWLRTGDAAAEIARSDWPLPPAAS
jgi:DNA mismatch endonuclease (patch repair protein)